MYTIVRKLFTDTISRKTRTTALIYIYREWNVVPLIGNFGGRVGYYRFLQSPPIPRMLPSFFFFFFFISTHMSLFELSLLINLKESVEIQLP